MNIYIGNLSFKVEEDDLKEIFEAYGEVDTVKIISDKFTGKSKGFGFIEMPEKDDALKAIEELNGKEVEGRNIIVNQAREKTEGGRSDSRGGGGGSRGGNDRRNFSRPRR
jgi:RNA recognition motif-containing protein